MIVKSIFALAAIVVVAAVVSTKAQQVKKPRDALNI